jgi:hypothetical protein
MKTDEYLAEYAWIATLDNPKLEAGALVKKIATANFAGATLPIVIENDTDSLETFIQKIVDVAFPKMCVKLWHIYDELPHAKLEHLTALLTDTELTEDEEAQILDLKLSFIL